MLALVAGSGVAEPSLAIAWKLASPGSLTVQIMFHTFVCMDIVELVEWNGDGLASHAVDTSQTLAWSGFSPICFSDITQLNTELARRSQRGTKLAQWCNM